MILGSRVDGTSAVAQALAQGRPDAVLLSASAVGWYGDTGDRLTDETGPTGQGFLAEVCRQWEGATAPAQEAGVRVVHLRTGIVLSSEGGALATQLPIFKIGAGAPLGSGRQWVPWISLQDEVAAIVHLLTADVRGPVNLVAPEPVTNRAFTKALGAALHRPTLPIAVPGFVLKAALGGFAEEGVLAGQRLAPAVLQRSGFAFPHRDRRRRARREPVAVRRPAAPRPRAAGSRAAVRTTTTSYPASLRGAGRSPRRSRPRRAPGSRAARRAGAAGQCVPS